jgi:uncharacterized protein DUF5916/cellulose/xylan binding protein with CBM9 domain
MDRHLLVLFLTLLTILLSTPTKLIAQSAARPEVHANRAVSPPEIDGVLGEQEWGTPVPATEWLSYNPLHGDRVPQETTAWVSYDENYLYFAFKCDDPEPSGIKTSITRRDNIWQDDWIGLSLDALGTGQFSYHMLVNPSGVQLDMLNSAAGGEDTAPDWLWDSAGRLTDQGYVVEIRLPLQSIRFKGGRDTRMGLLFWRRVSRLGVSVAWPPLSPSTWVFERHASLRFDELRPRLPREVLPSATYGRTETHETPAGWTATDKTDVGFSGKAGLSSTITLDATVNPDFSQVESDAFQVEVNQRFPVFFGEKRPFFMEGAGIFTLAGTGNGDSSMRTAVHTRRIIDPIFGAKLTGSVGRVTFGTLSAVDEAVPENAAPGDKERNRLFNIARAQYSLGPSNYVGALATDMSFGSGYNRVVGADLRWKLGDVQRIEGFALASRSRAPGGDEAASGIGAQANYSYETRQWVAIGSVEHFDPEFDMATAFIKRVGITSAWGFVDRSFYPDKTRYPWLRRMSVLSFTQGGRDRLAGGNDLLEVAGVRFNFTRQGFLRVQRTFGFEHWQGERFERGGLNAFGSVQLFRWLSLGGNIFRGRSVFYDLENPYQGRAADGGIDLTLQPNGQLSQSLGYNRVAFDRESTGARIFTVNIVNSKTTYQFTRALSIRGIVQYDSSRNQVLTDLLSSFEPRPGTVVYAGYGSLLERREFVDGRWVRGAGLFETSRRGLFFKTSYLYRF